MSWSKCRGAIVTFCVVNVGGAIDGGACVMEPSSLAQLQSKCMFFVHSHFLIHNHLSILNISGIGIQRETISLSRFFKDTTK